MSSVYQAVISMNQSKKDAPLGKVCLRKDPAKNKNKNLRSRIFWDVTLC
jgi:hypothetical protein